MDVAIVGMACRFPGAGDLATFWANILAGRDATREVPADRWDPAEFFDPRSKSNDRVPGRRGGYLDDPIPFDPHAFGIMPVAVDGGEPEQFLVLDAARSALADAGLPEGVPDGRRVEVVVGRGNYFNRGNLTRLQHGRVAAQTIQVLRALHPEWTESDLDAIRADLKASLPPFGPDTVPGQLTNATAGRIANRLNFRGASFVVDAASASALVALDLGARALIERRADLAVVGAVYLQCDVDFPMVFGQLGSLSRGDRARPFSADADGMLPGEGVGVVVLKRLADAERDGHRVYAVVKGVGLASDGRGPGLATPDPRGHALAMRRAYRRAGVEPGTVEFLEGHGLGVPAADRAELRALRKVFPPSRRRSLGSVSSMIGHAMPAAGMAGLIRTALALHHRMLPPTLHGERPHPLLADDRSPATLNDASRPWVHGAPEYPRRAGVNAFGFSGISAHAVLEEHADSAEDPNSPGAMLDWETEAFLLGAPDRATWIELARGLIDWIDRKPDVSLKDLAFTLNVDQPAFPFRVGLVASSLDDLKDRLAHVLKRLADPSCAAIRDGRGAYHWAEPLAGPGRLAILFPGEGSQYRGMLADLYPHFPEIRPPFDRSDRVALERKRAVLPSETLFGGAGEAESDLWSMDTAVSVVLSAQWGLFQLLSRLGLRPDAVAGHSSGEILALGAAGVTRIDRRFEDRLAVMGELFSHLESSGAVPGAGLVAVAADRERVEAVCRAAGAEASVAMDNCPHQVVLAVATERVGHLMGRLRGEGVACEALPFARAYHTEAFASALGPLREFFHGLPMTRPRIPIYSCATASRMPDDPEEIRSLAVDQWARAVAFRPMIEAMHEDGVRLFVEVGTRGNLTGFVEDTLRGRPAFAVAANLPRRSGLTQINHLVACLFAQGVSLRPIHLYGRRRPTRVDLSETPVRKEPVQRLAVGFPEMRLSPQLVESLRRRSAPVPHVKPESPPAPPPPEAFPLVEGVARDDEAMIAYLKTMEEFITVQRDVMAAYLGNQPTEPGGLLAGPAGPGDDPRESRSMDGGKTIPEPVPEPQDPPSQALANTMPEPRRDVPSVETLLLEKVAARTGYPIDMLGLDLDLEADLGVDSIKRVEILGDLQAQGAFSRDVDLDGLTQARTLRQVIERLAPGRPEKEVRPGPWVGEIRSLTPGEELVAVRVLDAAADPVAAHHTLGGRRISQVDPGRLGLPVVPFAVMAEMLAQAADVLAPGRVLVALREVTAHRWIKYEDSPTTLEIQARRVPEKADEYRVAIFNRGVGQKTTRPGAEGPVVEGLVVFGDARPEQETAPVFEPDGDWPSRFTAESLYGDGWLFHGPAFRALTRVGPSSPRWIEGGIAVPNRRALLPAGTEGGLLTDVVTLDVFTHLLGCWGLDHLAEGEVIFPLKLGELTIQGTDPAEGTELSCRIFVREVDRHRVKIDADLVTPEGRIWMRLRNWEDWRFYWPNRFRDQFRAPEVVLVGEPVELSELGASESIVWLEPPGDFARPIWRDVMEAVHLDPEERAELRDLSGPERRKTLRLWGRVAAKEAARRLWVAEGRPPVFPADLVIRPDRHGRPVLRSRLEPGREDLPPISIAHTEGVALAIASLDPSARHGIDVERVVEREPRFLELAFSATERALIDRAVEAGGARDEWIARLWCAKEAAGKATGRGLIVGPGSVEVIDADPREGVVSVDLGPDLRAACPDWPVGPIRVSTHRRGAYAWAWTCGESVARS
jgi:acyl transferase domain-containing protein/phosphopantetheinyl transferase (holo-ACP synthase)